MRRIAMLDSAPRLGTKGILLLICIVVVAIVVDSEIGVISDFIPEFISSTPGISLFLCFAIVYAVTGFFILSYVKKIGRESGAKALRLSLAHKLVTGVHISLVVVIAVVVLQILVTSQYNTLTLAITLSLSYSLWIVTMSFLARAFFSWYKSKASQKESQSNRLVLILGFSMIAYVINGIFILADYLIWLQGRPPVILSTDIAFFPPFEPDNLISQIGAMPQIASAIAYVLTWISTAILLRPYIKKIGKLKFWCILGFALVYYLISFPLFILGYFTPTGETDIEVMNNILLLSMSSIVTGIIFGAAFLAVARTLKRGTTIRDYLILAAYGMLIFYIAGSATVSQAAYPPFGLVSTAFTGLSTYLVYVGLYSSAITLSQDLTLRKSIRRSVMEQSKLLDSIGTAQMERELQTRVLTVAKKTSDQMSENSGVQVSLSEDDVKDYMKLVIRELKTTL